MERSKYGKYSHTRIPRRKRTIALEGVKEDTGKWFKCWNCGFPNNIDRNSVGEGEGNYSEVGGFGNGGFGESGFGGGAGTSPETLGFGDGDFGNNGFGGKANLDAIRFSEPVGLEITGGCSFCGCMNYR